MSTSGPPQGAQDHGTRREACAAVAGPRLLLVNANTSVQVTRILAAAARAAAAPGTTIEARTAPSGVAVVRNAADHAIATAACLQMVRAAGACDAVLIGVSLDTALEEARRTCALPVVGMTGAALEEARRSGRRVGVLTIGETMKTLFCERFGTQAADFVHAVALDPRMALDDPGRAASLLAQGVEALADRGAGIAIPVGATVAGLADVIALAAPIPVLDSIGCAVRAAQHLVAQRQAVRP